MQQRAVGLLRDGGSRHLVVEVRQEALKVASRQLVEVAKPQSRPQPAFAFEKPGALGILGQSTTMWIIDDIEQRTATLDFSSSGQGHVEVTQVVVGDTVLANAATLTDWSEDPFQIEVCGAPGAG